MNDCLLITRHKIGFGVKVFVKNCGEQPDFHLAQTRWKDFVGSRNECGDKYYVNFVTKRTVLRGDCKQL